MLLGLDEYANLLWAVERRVAGHEVVRPAPAGADDPGGEPAEAPAHAYVPGRDAAPCWHPYEVEERDGRRRFVQRRLADVSGVDPVLTPAATAEVLRVHAASGTEVVHEIEPATVPSIGTVLERRHRLARDVLGNPVLWSQRQRSPFLHPPSRALRFDLLSETAPDSPCATRRVRPGIRLYLYDLFMQYGSNRRMELDPASVSGSGSTLVAGLTYKYGCFGPITMSAFASGYATWPNGTASYVNGISTSPYETQGTC